MSYNLVLKILDAILLTSKKKIKKTTLENFFVGYDLNKLIKKLNERYKNLGFFVYQDKDYVELLNRPELFSYLINFFSFEDNELMRDFLEVLAIVAYGGPLTIKEINNLRGKTSVLILKELLVDGFVEKEKNNYRISSKFLKILGFNCEEELPDYQNLRKELRREL